MNIIEVGLLPRKPLRRYLYKNNIYFNEDKSLLTSIFYIPKIEEKNAREIQEWIRNINDTNHDN